jgi:DNA polymerase III subunit alpha
MHYTPLNIISSYSLLNSTISIDNLILTAKQRGYTALALTDENVMYGVIEFYDKCIANGIHPIIGLTVKMNNLIPTDLDNEIVLLAQNNRGYRNLMKISTLVMTSTKGKLDWNALQSYLQGLCIIIPDTGEWSQLLDNNQLECYNNVLQPLIDYSNQFHIYLGIGETSLNNKVRLERLKQLKNKLRLNLVAMSKVQILNSSDYFSLKVMNNIAMGQKLSNPLQESHELAAEWLKDPQEIISAYVDNNLLEAIENNQEIADNCNIDIEKKQPLLPHYNNQQGISSQKFLTQLCLKGLEIRLKTNHISNKDIYLKRLKKELTIINRMGFDDYFLIVWDVINFAHKHGIMTGPGRGSAAGSLVSFCLSITDVDPLKYGLLFERFLNEQRAQMPDIDLDIPDTERDIILQYVHDKYGHKHVSQIVTFDTMAAKQALRDVGRTFNLSMTQMNEWSNAVPITTGKMTLNMAYQQSQKLQNLVSDNELNKLLFATASQIEGLPRHISTHAAGLILSKSPIIEISPLQTGNEQLLMTQYSKNYVEKLGLLKIDFLGLKNLSLLANIVKLIRQQVDSNFKIQNININDVKTLQLFQQGDTNGIFQFESNGIKRVLRNIHPDSFDLVAVVDALYRPGPMKNIDTFINRKNNQEPVPVADTSLQNILGPTFGIIVYQEQVMQVASIMGGFSLGEADLLRRAMSKKKKNVMDSMKAKFITGALNKGYDLQTAQQTFDYIDQFASYGFNKSHAVAYSKMAFELTYLKAHYEVQFFTCILNSITGNHDKMKTYIFEAKGRHINIKAPDINVSDDIFTCQNRTIVFGLNTIKGLRSDFIKNILAERQQHGIFKDLEEFIYRIDAKFRKKELLVGLAYVGAFDCFGYNRNELVASIDEFIESINLSGNSMELFEVLKPKLIHKDDMELQQKLSYEQQYVGVYLSGHPVEYYGMLQNSLKIVSSMSIGDWNVAINCLIYVEYIKKIRTKKGDEMAFVSGTDLAGKLNVTIFPKIYQNVRKWIRVGMVILIKGIPEKRNNEYQLIANRLWPAANIKSQMIKKHINGNWYLKIDFKHNNNIILQKVFQLIKDNPGNHPVVIFNVVDNVKRKLNRQYNLNYNQKVYNSLIYILGKNNVVYK